MSQDGVKKKKRSKVDVDHQKYILTLPVPTLVITEYKCVWLVGVLQVDEYTSLVWLTVRIPPIHHDT